jgi:hypothetical protein
LYLLTSSTKNCACRSCRSSLSRSVSRFLLTVGVTSNLEGQERRDVSRGHEVRPAHLHGRKLTSVFAASDQRGAKLRQTRTGPSVTRATGLLHPNLAVFLGLPAAPKGATLQRVNDPRSIPADGDRTEQPAVERIVVFVPGVMGSSLVYRGLGLHGEPIEDVVWGGDIQAILDALSMKATMLLEDLDVGEVIRRINVPFRSVDVYGRLLDFCEDPMEGLATRRCEIRAGGGEKRALGLHAA